MVAKTTTTVNTEKVDKKEKRRRVIFAIKLALYILLIFFIIEYIEVPDEESIYGRAINAILFYVTGHLIVSLSRITIAGIYLRKHHLKHNIRNNFLLGINRVANVISTLVFIIAALSMFQISLPQLFTGISIVAAAIAILSKDYISNMINGLIIMFSDQISLNDYVKIGEHKGKINDINFINIHLINDDEDLVYIPNSAVLNSDVVNFTKQRVKKSTIEFEIDAKRAGEIADLEKYLNDSLKEYGGLIKKDSYTLKVSRIGKDLLQLKYQFVFQKENREVEKQIRRLLPRKVIEFLNR